MLVARFVFRGKKQKKKVTLQVHSLVILNATVILGPLVFYFFPVFFKKSVVGKSGVHTTNF